MDESANRIANGFGFARGGRVVAAATVTLPAGSIVIGPSVDLDRLAEQVRDALIRRARRLPE